MRYNKAKIVSSQVPTLIILLVVVCVVVCIAHWPALKSSTIFFDDDEYLVENPLVQNPSWSSTKRFLVEVLSPSTVRGYYQPLAMISLMLDYAAGGRPNELRVFHRTSLGLHVINSTLVIVFFYLLFGRCWPAAIAGLLFGLHPLTADSVVWLAERKTLLAGCFSLCSLILYVYFVRRDKRKLYVLSLLAYILAVLSKPTSLMLPFLLILLDFWPLRRLSKRAVIEKIPFFVVFVFAAAVTFISQRRLSPVGLASDFSLIRTGLVLGHNIVFYAVKTVWPIHLSSYYPFPEPFTISHWPVLAGLLGTCVLIMLLFLSLYKTRALLTSWLFFFVAILPTMQLVTFTDVIAANRFMYLPLLGFLLPVASFLSWFLYSRRAALPLTARRAATLVAVIALGCSELVLTYGYLQNWRDTVSLYRYMVRLSPNSAKLHNNLGNALMQLREINEAIEQYRIAIRLDPDYVRVHTNLGNALGELGRYDDAIEHYRTALRMKPDPAASYYKIHYNLAVVLARQRRADEAIDSCREAIQLEPDFAPAHQQLGLLLASQSRLDEAIDEFNIVLRMQPWNVQTCCQVGILLERQGKITEAIQRYHQALRVDPGNKRARQLLEAALAKQGNR